MIKVIAGKYRNLNIPIAENATYRPSTGRFKEAVFSILTSGEFGNKQYIHNSRVLDLFSGSGSLGFEAISRGASFASFIDINRNYLKTSEQFAKDIGIFENTLFLCLNALYLPMSRESYDTVFIDPPYHYEFVTKSLDVLLAGNWLNHNALVVVELAKADEIIIPHSYQLKTKRIYGNNKLLILQYSKTD